MKILKRVATVFLLIVVLLGQMAWFLSWPLFTIGAYLIIGREEILNYEGWIYVFMGASAKFFGDWSSEYMSTVASNLRELRQLGTLTQL